MNFNNEIWHAKIDEKDNVVRLYFKNQKRPITMTTKEFCALGAIIHQVKGAIK